MNSRSHRQGLELKIFAGASGQVKVGCRADATPVVLSTATQAVDLGNPDGWRARQKAPDQALASNLQQRALGWSLLVFFGLGLLLAFTRVRCRCCPFWRGLIVGSGATPRRGVASAGSYAVSMALVYAAMGVWLHPAGRTCKLWLQNPGCWAASRRFSCRWRYRCSASSSCNCRYAVRDRLENVSRNQRGGSLIGAGALGALSGLLVGPA